MRLVPLCGTKVLWDIEEVNLSTSCIFGYLVIISVVCTFDNRLQLNLFH